MYHGTPEERAEIRRTSMPLNTDNEVAKPEPEPQTKASKGRGRAKGSVKGRKSVETRKSGRSSTMAKARVVEDDEEDEEEEEERPEPTPKKGKPTSSKPMSVPGPPASDDEKAAGESSPQEQFLLPHQVTTFPVVITTYEMIIKDRVHLAKYKWGQVIVDEGHRLKNMDCKLMREVKKYDSAWRMVLSGTPLQVCFLPLVSVGIAMLIIC